MLKKKYGIFRIDENGTLLGYIEKSFGMGWDKNFVRAWDLRDIQSMWDNHISCMGVREHKPFVKYAKGIKGKYPNAFIVKITGNLPKQFANKLGKTVRIHWKERQKILNRTEEEQKIEYISKKFHYRNVQFSVF